MRTTAHQTRAAEDLVAELLELFYPVHYKGGMALEDAMRDGRLTRKQVAILWLIRSEGGHGSHMARKEIERLLTTWFEISSSAITKALRSMARPPLSLVQVIEDPQSGREKQVLLTAKGERFLLTMIAQGRGFLRKIVEQIPEEEVRNGIQFLRRAVTAFEQARAQGVIRNGRKRSLR
jgi:DNA-binding MarR family transcriptional regulator